MPNQIRGKILQIGVIQNLTTKSGNDFRKREFVLDCTTYDTYTGEQRPNYPSFSLMSKHVTDIDVYKQGDDVLVSFFISGRPWEKDGVTRYINDVVAYKIEPIGQQYSQPHQSAPKSQATQVFSQQPMDSLPFSPNANTSSFPRDNTDDLPF